MKSQQRKVIAVTDAGPLGRALAVQLTQQNYRVAIFYVGYMDQHAESIMQELGKDKVFAVAIEFTKVDMWLHAMEATKEYFGMYPQKAVVICDEWRGGNPLHYGEPEDFSVYNKVQEGNLESVYKALRVFLQAMVKEQKGSIVVTGSQLAERPISGAGAAAYTATKAGCLALVQAAAKEVINEGVTINAVLFAMLNRPEERAGLPNFDSSNWVSVDSVARVVIFLLSDDAADVTGAIVPVYGKYY